MTRLTKYFLLVAVMVVMPLLAMNKLSEDCPWPKLSSIESILMEKFYSFKLRIGLESDDTYNGVHELLRRGHDEKLLNFGLHELLLEGPDDYDLKDLMNSAVKNNRFTPLLTLIEYRGVERALAPNKRNETLVLTAASFGRHAILQFLLANGADPSIESDAGVTALTAAAGNGDAIAAGMLMEAGADCDQKMTARNSAYLGRTARDLACGKCVELFGSKQKLV